MVDLTSLPLDSMMRIEKVCANFEDDRERRIPFAHWLQGFQGRERAALLHELISIEWEIQSNSGAHVDPRRLEGLAADDQAIAEESLSKLSAAATGTDETDEPAAFSVPKSSHESHERLQFGPYQILRKLGEGGMGRVYLAEQSAPVKRNVAIKIIQTSAPCNEVLARFDAERQALAMMDHQHIATMYDAGITPEGRPYFAMEYVDGLPIDAYCRKHRLGLAARLEMFLQVCRAVQHAHQKGVAHRDLKPANVLVAERDGAPRVMIIDFGLAKALEADLTNQSLVTQQGQLFGTFAYMSPEQACMTGDVDARTDVYSLGAILFELLVDSTPLPHDEIRKSAFDEVLQRIREQEPPRPSWRLRASHGVGDWPIPVKPLRTELDWIVLRALEKARSRRYETPSALADDIQRFLDGEAVVARPPSWSYRLGKAVRKRKALFASLAIMVLLLLGGLCGTITMWLRAAGAEGIAQFEKGNALRQARDATTAKARMEVQRNLAIKAKETADKNAARANYFLAVARWDAGNVRAANNLLWKVPPKYRDFPWRFARSAFRGSDVVAYPALQAAPTDLEIDLESQRLVIVSDAIHLLDSRTAEAIKTINLSAQAACFGESSDKLYCASRFLVDEVDIDSGATRRLLELPEMIRDIQQPSGDILTILDRRGGVHAFHLQTRKLLWSKAGGGMAFHNLAVSDTGLVAWSTGDGTLRVCESQTGELVWQTDVNQGGSLAFTPEGDRLIQAGRWLAGVDVIRCFEARTGRVIWEQEVIDHGCSSLAISPDGALAAIGMGASLESGQIWIVEVSSGNKLHSFHGHLAAACCVRFGRQGRRLYSAGLDSTVRFWDARNFTVASVLPHRETVEDVAYTRDGKQLLVVSSGHLSRWDMATTSRIAQRRTHGREDWTNGGGAFGNDVFAVATSQGIEIRDVATSALRFVVDAELSQRFRSLAVSPDETQLAAAYDDSVRIWDLSSPDEPTVLSDFTAPVAWLADHQLIARKDGHAVCLNVETMQETWRRRNYQVLATLADSHAAVAAGRSLKVLDDETGREIMALETTHEFYGAAFHPDGKTLATIDSSRRLRLWNIASGEEMISCLIKAERYMLTSVTFSPRGDQLAVTGNRSGAVFLFDVPDQGQAYRLAGHSSRVNFATFSPDGKRIYSEAGEERFVWSAATGERELDAVWDADKSRRIVASGSRRILFRNREIEVLNQGYAATRRESAYRKSKHHQLMR